MNSKRVSVGGVDLLEAGEEKHHFGFWFFFEHEDKIYECLHEDATRGGITSN